MVMLSAATRDGSPWPACAARCTPVERAIHAGGRAFPLLVVADVNALLEAIDPTAFAADERLPYWADVWASAPALAAFCLQTPALRGTAVLELGCGLGLAGIAAAVAGARVTKTDYEADALDFARCNVERNLPGAIGSGTVRLRPLDWRAPERIGTFDWILGADVAYDRGSMSALLQTVAMLLDPRGTAVFTDPDRATGGAFAAAAQKAGFLVNTAREAAPSHDGTTAIVRYELRRASTP